MENKDKNVIEINSHSGFVVSDEDIANKAVEKKVKTTNPITKNFTKFIQRSKDKFSIKDIFR